MKYEGDVKLFITHDGAEIKYEGGQPEMETGIENQILISLFTKKGWAGNAFLPPEKRIGSGFEETCAGSITASKLADIENAAVKALKGRSIKTASCKARNPSSDALSVTINIGNGATALSRSGGAWQTS